MPTPQYSPRLLVRLIYETKDIKDHINLIELYKDLHEQGDIDFNFKLKDIISAPNHYFRFVGAIHNMKDLCTFNLYLDGLQQKGFATVTCMLTRRIAFQRELIIAKNQNKY